MNGGSQICVFLYTQLRPVHNIVVGCYWVETADDTFFHHGSLPPTLMNESLGPYVHVRLRFLMNEIVFSSSYVSQFGITRIHVNEMFTKKREKTN